MNASSMTHTMRYLHRTGGVDMGVLTNMRIGMAGRMLADLGLRTMKIIIFADNDGCSRSIRSKCIQPGLRRGDMNIDKAETNAVYTAVMEVWEI